MDRVSLADRVKYFFYTLISRIGAFAVMMILVYVWSEIVMTRIFKITELSIATVGAYLIIIVAWTIVPATIMKMLIKNVPFDFYEKEVPDKKTQLSDFLLYALPGEIIWTILRIIPFGFYVNYKFGQLLAYPSFVLFDSLYISPLGLHDRIFNKLQYTATDFLVYGIFDVLLSALLIYLYYRGYKKLAAEQEETLRRREEKYKNTQYF